MKRWLYRTDVLPVRSADLHEVLTEAGAAGWELVFMTAVVEAGKPSFICVFKQEDQERTSKKPVIKNPVVDEEGQVTERIGDF